MEVILIRHGTGARGDTHSTTASATAEPADAPELSARGNHSIQRMIQALRLRNVRPDLVLTSKMGHALATATLLRDALSPSAKLLQLSTLTPGTGPADLADLRDEAGRALTGLQDDSTVLVVGHEGRLSNLVTELTGKRLPRLPHGGALCVCGAHLVELLTGLGTVRFRYPVVDHLEEELRPKITSKMTAASLLAGFVLTALAAVLVIDAHDWHRVVAIACLTTSLVLLVSAVFIFDQLSMPSGFWTDSARPVARSGWQRWIRRRQQQWIRLGEARLEARWDEMRAKGHAKKTEEERRRAADDDWLIAEVRNEGPAYHLMVATSRRIFTPAIGLGALGLVALLIGTDERWIWGLGLSGLVIASAYAYWNRPDLGAD